MGVTVIGGVMVLIHELPLRWVPLRECDIAIDMGVAAGAITQAVQTDLSTALFQFFEQLPGAAITSTLAVVLVTVFFVTSADSGSLVIDTITAGGKTNAPVSQRIFWASFEGLVAIALLLGGGLAALQAAAVSTGLPFAVVLLLGCWGLIRGLMNYAFWVPNGSPEYRYCLHESVEECNHTMMFQEMVNRIGADVPGMPRMLKWLSTFIPLATAAM